MNIFCTPTTRKQKFHRFLPKSSRIHPLNFHYITLETSTYEKKIPSSSSRS